MFDIRRILHPTDFSAYADAALRQALLLGQLHEAEVHLLHVTPALGEDPIRDAFAVRADEERFYREQWKESDQQMKRLLAAHRPEGVTVRRVHTRGPSPGLSILEYERAEDIDLIVMGTHGRRGLRRALLGSVAEEVVHQAQAPVLCMRRRVPDPGIQRLLVPFDFSDHAREALAAGRELATAYGVRLDVLHVLTPAYLPYFYGGTCRPAWTEQDAITALRQAYDAVGGPWVPDVAFYAATGRPSSEIEAFAEICETDLIVMSSHGQTSIEQFSLGSVAERVLRRAPCSVLLTRAFGRPLRPIEEESQSSRASWSRPSMRV